MSNAERSPPPQSSAKRSAMSVRRVQFSEVVELFHVPSGQPHEEAYLLEIVPPYGAGGGFKSEHDDDDTPLDDLTIFFAQLDRVERRKQLFPCWELLVGNNFLGDPKVASGIWRRRMRTDRWCVRLAAE